MSGRWRRWLRWGWLPGPALGPLVFASVALGVPAPSNVPHQGTLKINFSYSGHSPAYRTTQAGIPLSCVEYWGPGRLYVVCKVVMSKPKGGPA